MSPARTVPSVPAVNTSFGGGNPLINTLDALDDSVLETVDGRTHSALSDRTVTVTACTPHDHCRAAGQDPRGRRPHRRAVVHPTAALAPVPRGSCRTSTGEVPAPTGKACSISAAGSCRRTPGRPMHTGTVARTSRPRIRQHTRVRRRSHPRLPRPPAAEHRPARRGDLSIRSEPKLFIASISIVTIYC